MQLQDIKHGTVTIELSPPDCAVLAKMSRLACQHSTDEEIDMWQAMTTLFHACAIASYGQWHICAEDEQTINDQLRQVGLRPWQRLNGREYSVSPDPVSPSNPLT